jgi:hypothetical protein
LISLNQAVRDGFSQCSSQLNDIFMSAVQGKDKYEEILASISTDLQTQRSENRFDPESSL